jgi:hypothetical protein
LRPYISNIPETTIKSLHLWTLFTAIYTNLEIYNLIFSLVIYIPEATSLENLNGTIRYIINFIINSTIIQILFVFIAFFVSIIFNGILKIPNAGLMPITLAEITLLSLANPNRLVTFFCIPLKFKARYYPFVIYATFLLMNLKIHIDVIIGFVYGFMHFYFLRSLFEISNETIQSIEDKMICAKFFDSFIALAKVKQSFKYSTFRGNNSQSSIDIPTTPTSNMSAVSPGKLNERGNIKIPSFDTSLNNYNSNNSGSNSSREGKNDNQKK